MPSIQKNFLHQFDKKYGFNPQKKPRTFFSTARGNFPFSLVNSQQGYVNLLNAINVWQLVAELEEFLEVPVATSFKHVAPAGAAVNGTIDETIREVYDCNKPELTPLAKAHIRKLGEDPKKLEN